MIIQPRPISAELGLSLGKRPEAILVICTSHLLVVPNLFQHILFRTFFYIHTFPHASNTLKNISCNQYNETNVMHFPFNLLRIKSLYMFRALLALQEASHKLHLVYCVRIISFGCGKVAF
jgi:hypothetical protein